MKKKNGLSKPEAVILGKLLEKARFPLPKPAFDGWVENLPHVALELAVVWRSKIDWQVFMTQRGPGDKFWPYQWNMPGTIIRQNETTPQAYNRLLASEMFSGGETFGKLRFVGVRDLLKGKGRKRCRRGHELSHLYTVTFRGKKLNGGKFFPLSRLPRNTVPHHHTLVAMVKRFLGN